MSNPMSLREAVRTAFVYERLGCTNDGQAVERDQARRIIGLAVAAHEARVACSAAWQNRDSTHEEITAACDADTGAYHTLIAAERGEEKR